MEGKEGVAKRRVRKKKLKDKEQTSEAIERMQIREYGRKINEKTRNRRLN